MDVDGTDLEITAGGGIHWESAEGERDGSGGIGSASFYHRHGLLIVVSDGDVVANPALAGHVEAWLFRDRLGVSAPSIPAAIVSLLLFLLAVAEVVRGRRARDGPGCSRAPRRPR